MSWGRVDGDTASGPDTVQTPDLDTATATLLIAHVASYYGAGVEPVLTDFYNNIWIPLPLYATAFAAASRLYYCINPTVGGGHWFKSTGTGVFQTLWALALSATGTVTYDQETGATNTGITTLQASSITPTTAAAFAISGGAQLSAATGFDITGSGVFNTEITQYVGGDHLAGGIGERFNDGTAWQPTWDWDGLPQNASMSNATFLESTAGNRFLLH